VTFCINIEHRTSFTVLFIFISGTGLLYDVNPFKVWSEN